MITLEEYKEIIKKKKSKHIRVDYSDDFYILIKKYAPHLIYDISREYRFVREIVGDGKGLRSRIKDLGLGDWRFDFAFISRRIAVEIDGGQYAFRGGRHNTDEDRHKINCAVVMGWKVLRFSGTQIKEDPLKCIQKIDILFYQLPIQHIQKY